MSTLLIHISDIHLNGKAASFPDRASKLVDAALSPIAAVDGVHIIVSGDLANWGLDEEFCIGLRLIDGLRASVRQRLDIEAKVFLSAGNHDCNFSGDQSVREVLIQTVRRDPTKLTPSIAKQLGTVLSRFLEIQKQLAPEIEQVDVWHAVAHVATPEPIRYMLLNSSVTSLKEDEPGKLFMPVPPVEDSISGQRTVYVMHHPFNWFMPDNGRELAQHAAAAADLFLMGHEHVFWAQSSHELYDDASVTYLKGHVLRDTEEENNSAFQTVQIDSKAGFMPRAYRWRDGRYEPWLEKSRDEYIAWPSQNGTRKLGLSTEGYRELTSAGANFTHRKKDTISLVDIFVWPTIRSDGAGPDGSNSTLFEKEFSAQMLVDEYGKLPGIIVIRGSEQSGKSALAKMLALHLSRKSVQPILLAASNVSSWREKSLNDRIDRAIDSMYGRAFRSDYRQLPAENKVLIVDDFDLSQVVAGYFDGLRALQQHFGRIVLMLDSHPGLEVALNEFLRDECFIEASVFDILNTNYSNRLELIERWLSIGAHDSRMDDMKVTAAKLSKVVDETLGRNLIPAVPVFILIVLQRAELAQDLDTVVKSGSQGFLYESLILQALSAKVKVFNVVTCLAYLTSFAGHLKHSHLESVSQVVFEEFHVNHCKKFALAASVTQLQMQLVSADILEDRDGNVRFKYPFHNYYFTARALAQIDSWLLLEPEIDSLVKSIHTEKSANVLLFLAHLERNPRIAEKIIEKASGMFFNYEKADFFAPLQAIDNYDSGKIRSILLDGSRGQQLVEHERDLLDADISQHELTAMAEARLKDRLEDALSMNAAFKTLQVLGQILRNHAGEIERQEKSRIAETCTSLGLRVLGFLFSIAAEHGSEMIDFRAAQIRAEKPKITDSELAAELENYLPDIISTITVGALIKIANAIGAEDLAPTLGEVLETNDTTRLLKLVIQLEHFSDFPKEELLDYEQETLARGKFLPNVVMRRFVIRRFYLFPIRDELKRAVLDRFKIKALPFQFLEQQRLGKD